MRGHFSIEWMAQSSQAEGPTGLPACTRSLTGLNTSGTHSESLPGFYSRPRPQTWQNQEHKGGSSSSSSSSKPLGTEQPSGLADSEKSLPHQQTPHKDHREQVTEAGFSSGTEEETSGYESEGGRSLSPSAPEGASGCPTPQGRRPRTAFTAEQISSLEKAFKRNAYLGTQEKAELCKKLDLSDKQIRNWFQNRRMKLKRTVQDALAHACQANVASQFLHYPEMQAYRPGPYPRYHHSAQEGSTVAPYLHPHSLQYSSAAAFTLDSFYQYPSLPGMALPTGTSPLIGSYQPYPQPY